MNKKAIVGVLMTAAVCIGVLAIYLNTSYLNFINQRS